MPSYEDLAAISRRYRREDHPDHLTWMYHEVGIYTSPRCCGCQARSMYLGASGQVLAILKSNYARLRAAIQLGSYQADSGRLHVKRVSIDVGMGPGAADRGLRYRYSVSHCITLRLAGEE